MEPIDRPTWADTLEALAGVGTEGEASAATSKAIIEKAMAHGLPAPVVFVDHYAEAAADIIWQWGISRVTVHVWNPSIEISVVPQGPANPFTTMDTDVAAAYAAGALHGMESA